MVRVNCFASCKALGQKCDVMTTRFVTLLPLLADLNFRILPDSTLDRQKNLFLYKFLFG